MLVVQPCLQGLLSTPSGADKDRPEVDPGEVQPLLERMHRAAGVRRSQTDLDLAPAGLGVERQHGAVVEDLDPAA